MSTSSQSAEDRRLHNQPESGAITLAEAAIMEAGRAAWTSLRKTFDQWVAIGRAVKLLREKADRDGRRQTFKVLMRQQGFSIEGKPENGRVLDPSRVTRLLHIMENLSAVQAWHEQLSPYHQLEWSSPDAVYRHCPVFAAVEDKANSAEKPLSAVAKLKISLAALEEENARLKKADGGTRDISINPKDKVGDIADVLVRGLGDKVVNLIAALRDRLKAQGADDAARKPKKPKES